MFFSLNLTNSVSFSYDRLNELFLLSIQFFAPLDFSVYLMMTTNPHIEFLCSQVTNFFSKI